ncbi:MAG: 30S ribosomal protein S27e [Nitrososphaerota archaeon]|nr:30S ribosomal protein S27e [Nitrososphaerota archaeon]
MKRDREPIPQSRSSFLLVKCPDCGEERIVFSNSSKDVGCSGCGRELAESRGGKAYIQRNVAVVKRLG